MALTTEYVKTRANELLKLMFGAESQFRDGQLEAIVNVTVNGGKHLLVQKTGWGKSVVYFIITKILRENSKGPTLLVSPLLALMRNQVYHAKKLGIVAETINSSNYDNWEEIIKKIKNKQVDLLLVSPERLSNQNFTQDILPAMGNIGAFVVDEVHCISDWGHDFRPDYRRIKNLIQNLFGGIPILGTTATANNRVVKDLEEQFGIGIKTTRGPLTRKGLKLQNIVLGSVAERMAWLAEFVPQLPGSGIIYCLTRKDVYRVSAWLKSRGIQSHHYWGGDVSDDDGVDSSEQLEMKLLNNEIKVLVATSALGMGYDKPDLGFVIHYQAPGSVIAYYQQVGRAGRAVPESYGVLLHGQEEEDILDYFMREAFPTIDESKGIVDTLSGMVEGSVADIEMKINLKHNRIEKALKHLEIEGFVSRNKNLYSVTAKKWSYDSLKVETVTQTRKVERETIRSYISHSGCLMKFITGALDDPTSENCGICVNCKGSLLSNTPNKSLVKQALEFLSQDYVIVESRKRWPNGLALGKTTSGAPSIKMQPNLIIEQGRALTMLEKVGFGDDVINAIKSNHSFSLDVIDASLNLIQNKWKPDPPPQWVTFIPSSRRNDLIKSFAKSLATGLKLPFYDVVKQIKSKEPMKSKNNPQQKVLNLIDVYSIESLVNAGPVLLVDDFINSRWTFTIVGSLLKQKGVSKVYPFAAGQKKEL